MSTAAVKVRCTIAQPFVIAGTPFSLTTTVENVHEGPIELKSLTYHIPQQVQWIQTTEYQSAFNAQKAAPWWRRVLSRKPWQKAAQAHGEAMAWGDLANDFSATMATIPATESFSYSFQAVVPNWLFASGGELVFPGLVMYAYNGQRHMSEFDVRFVLRPPLISNCLGAIAGALLGASARGLQDQGPAFMSSLGLPFVASVLLTTMLAVIAVIYSSRRTGEAQPIVTVEDVWGGLLVGFMLGYVGHDFFRQLVPLKQ